MKTDLACRCGTSGVPKKCVSGWHLLQTFAGLLILLSAEVAAEVDVRTIAGGPVVLGGSPAGFADGSALNDSQFNGPKGLRVGSKGDLWVADETNGTVRLIQLQADKVSSPIGGLNRPVDLVEDKDANLYVLNRGSGEVRKYDAFGNHLTTVSGLTQPTALTIDSAGNLFVTEAGGAVKRVSPAGVVSLVANLESELNGIALWLNNWLAVSDTGRNAIRLVDSATGQVQHLAGSATGEAGFVNGTNTQARFNRPSGLARAAGGTLVVADRSNHRVRIVATNGLATTLYGIAPSNWVQDPYFEGWRDGKESEAEAREPVGVTVASDGTVYVSEAYYHILREIKGASFGGTTPPGDTNQPTNIVVTLPAPTIVPSSGYYPMGQSITVRSAVPDVYYTLDGSEPSTNSLKVTLNNGVGTIRWRESQRDLTSLRLRASANTNSSATTSGVPSTSNQLGVCEPPDGQAFLGSVGSTIVLPVVIQLRTNQDVRTIQFRVEVSPLTAAPPIPNTFRALSISTNDFVAVAGAAEEGKTATTSSFHYQLGSTTGLGISAIGTNAQFLARNYGVVAMLAVPIPGSAAEGDRYRITVLEASATSDAQQSPVALETLAPREILVKNTPYVVGDSSRGWWYNAGLYGNENLDNSDVNNIFYAAMGVREPYPFTDAFDAMDAFPPDVPNLAGGDGQIRYLDWQLILRRSLRLDSNNWVRVRGIGGGRLTQPGSLVRTSPSTPVETGEPGYWWREAKLSAAPISYVFPGQRAVVPVSLTVAEGAEVSGLLFRARVSALGAAPAFLAEVTFLSTPNSVPPSQTLSLDASIGCGWDLGAFSPPLRGTTLLGHLRFLVPETARTGDRYVVSFARADGAPNLSRQYDFETVRATVVVGALAPEFAEVASDEWKSTFFGSVDDARADATVDADQDGATNSAEYVAGTDPTNANSRPDLDIYRRTGDGAFVVRWATVPGRTYILERSFELVRPSWDAVVAGYRGDGRVAEQIDGATDHRTRFYRLRIQP